MAELTDRSTAGTSFFNTVIRATVNQLTTILGEAQHIQNSGEDKVNFQWECETAGGAVFTIYDWKEYRSIGEDELIEFHIGGMSALVTEKAKKELLQMLEMLEMLQMLK